MSCKKSFLLVTFRHHPRLLRDVLYLCCHIQLEREEEKYSERVVSVIKAVQCITHTATFLALLQHTHSNLLVLQCAARIDRGRGSSGTDAHCL